MVIQKSHSLDFFVNSISEILNFTQNIEQAG